MYQPDVVLARRTTAFDFVSDVLSYLPVIDLSAADEFAVYDHDGQSQPPTADLVYDSGDLSPCSGVG